MAMEGDWCRLCYEAVEELRGLSEALECARKGHSD
uniref:HEPN domain-containing protein n=1 Tax=Steinernema glaseri TaxID=37863 RepID=A0A1I8A1C3_9BILA